MSGGSCNNVFASELSEPQSDLESIVERLTALGLGQSEACLRTRIILDLYAQIDKLAGLSPHDGLRKVWMTVEWQISGDWTQEKVLHDVEEFEANRPKTRTPNSDSR